MKKPRTSINEGMNLKCDKCGGRVMSEREFLSEIHLELCCLNCGKRWFYHYPGNHGNFAIWLHKTEMEWVEWTTNH